MVEVAGCAGLLPAQTLTIWEAAEPIQVTPKAESLQNGPMDAGVAAILGAAVGGILGAGGTLAAAATAGRLQGRSQHEQWRREGRREAYSSFIACVGTFETAANSWMELDDNGQRGEVLTTALRAVEEQLNEVRATAPLVAIEGPEAVASLAAEISGRCEDFWASVSNATEAPERVSTFVTARTELLSI